jgi:phage terminase small subunit
VQSPYLAIVNRQAVLLLRCAEQLGFSPTARPRVAAAAPSAAQAASPADPDVPLSVFLASRPH